MIDTLSLCPVCYKKTIAQISFSNGRVIMHKDCDVHGHFEAVVEKSIEHWSNFYEYGTMGNNNTIIIHAHNQCNMECPWCYYPMGVEKMHEANYYDSILRAYKGTHKLLLSGGEPTLRPDYFEFMQELSDLGWYPATISNMLKIGEKDFFERTLNPLFIENKMYRFALSMQHPKNYSVEIFKQKQQAIENIRQANLKATCIMFSIQSLDELDWIKEFYDENKDTFLMIRIRALFKNWKNKNYKDDIFCSDLHKAFMEKFVDLCPIQCRIIEHSNAYCLYLQNDDGVHVSLSCSPTVENIDLNLCMRPAYMLALDSKPYPVPLCQIFNEGIDLGWKDGFKLETKKEQR